MIHFTQRSTLFDDETLTVRRYDSTYGGDVQMNDPPQAADAGLREVSRLSPEAGSRPKASVAGEACAPFVCRPASSALPTARERNGKSAVDGVIAGSADDASRTASESSDDALPLSPPARPPSAPPTGALATVRVVDGLRVFNQQPYRTFQLTGSVQPAAGRDLMQPAEGTYETSRLVWYAWLDGPDVPKPGDYVERDQLYLVAGVEQWGDYVKCDLSSDDKADLRGA